MSDTPDNTYIWNEGQFYITGEITQYNEELSTSQ
jgi:hypothetical protein